MLAKRWIALFFTALTIGTPSASDLDLALPGATSIDYASIRDASGVLGYAEPILGNDLADDTSNAHGPGASLVPPESVDSAWELPTATTIEDVVQALESHGKVQKTRTFRDGQIMVADYVTEADVELRLLWIEGTHQNFETRAVPEARPGPHVYLIAYHEP